MGCKVKRAMELCRTQGSIHDGKRPVEDPVNREEDYATATGNGLPMANLVRLMRQVIPTDIKISAHAKQLVHDCAVDFVGFVGSEATECARAQHRRTIAPEDFLLSFHRLGFDDYMEPMSTYIRRYREAMKHQNAALRPPTLTPSFTDEEVQFLMSVIPQSHEDAPSLEEEAPPAA